MHIHESAENYLETILILKNEKGAVRSIDIAQRMAFSKPSVSRAMSLLREKQLIIMDAEGWIQLTADGLALAERIYERHRLISGWLESIGVPSDIAAEDACRIEHDISDLSFEKIKTHIQNKNK